MRWDVSPKGKEQLLRTYTRKQIEDHLVDVNKMIESSMSVIPTHYAYFLASPPHV
jgi:hypothetical protein